MQENLASNCKTAFRWRIIRNCPAKYSKIGKPCKWLQFYLSIAISSAKQMQVEGKLQSESATLVSMSLLKKLPDAQNCRKLKDEKSFLSIANNSKPNQTTSIVLCKICNSSINAKTEATCWWMKLNCFSNIAKTCKRYWQKYSLALRSFYYAYLSGWETSFWAQLVSLIRRGENSSSELSRKLSTQKIM